MNSAHNTYTIAFYNIENLFDFQNDPLTNDDDFLPNARKRWTPKRYKNKLRKIGTVISKIGENEETSPTIIGLAEVENKKVLEDLLGSEHLRDKKYDFVHYDSADERGIDVALLYNKSIFNLESSEVYPVFLETENGERDYTRDILYVNGKLNNESIHLLVNHWSSRRQGQKETEHKRLEAAKTVNNIVQQVKMEDPNAKLIVMGDFNDNPNNDSLALIEKESRLFNPFKTIWSNDKGTLSHDFEWNLFDQILFTTNFFNSTKNQLSFVNANIFDEKFLKQFHGKYKGQPFRTFVGKKFKGGYSDHFPVYIQLKSY